MPEYRQSCNDCQEKRSSGLKKVLLGAGLAGAVLGLGSLAMAYFGTHPRRRPLRGTPEDEGLRFEDVEFTSSDGVRLSGWFIPCPGARSSIILCHGFPNNRSEMLPWVRMLRDVGTHLLLFDFRAMGLSDGRLSSIGYEEVNDLVGALDYLGNRSETDDLPIGVFGLSMGGAVALMTAARDKRISAVATHGAYATLDHAIRQRSRMMLGPFHRALSHPVKWWARRWSTVHPLEVSPLDAIRHITPRPVLILHGGRDLIAHPEDARALYVAARKPKRLVIKRRSWHVRIHPEEREGYEREIVGFFRGCLGP